MKAKNHHGPAVICYFIVLITALAMLHCSKDNGGKPSTPTDPAAAVVKVDEANRCLENKLYHYIETELEGVEKPDEIDFSECYNLYLEAYNYDRTNKDANFGLGITELMMLTQDPEVNRIFDEWKEYLQTTTPFEVPGQRPSSMNVFGANLGIATSIQDGKIEKSAIPHFVTSLMKNSFSNPPQLQDIQKVISDVILPKVKSAIAHLGVVEGDPNYTFTITPRMQGDPYEDPLELDLTEIYVSEVGLYALQAACEIATAYNINFSTYDDRGIEESFKTGGTFMTLKAGGASKLASAKQAILAGVDKLEQAVHFLRSEQDYQDDDIIKIGRDDLTEADLDSVLKYCDQVRTTMNSVLTYTADWDDDWRTPDESLQINLGKFFDNPITDFKAKLPPYSISVGFDKEMVWDWHEIPVTAQYYSSTSGYYSYYRWVSYWKGELYGQNWDDINIPEFDTKIDSLKNIFLSNPKYVSFYISIYFYGYLSAGWNTINEELYYDLAFNIDYYAPQITWAANSYSDWIFPDPTFNGILPGMTDARFKRIFGFDADDWKKTSLIEWGDFMEDLFISDN